jgi:OmpR-family two-component system manganese-sensing response regulator
MMLQSANHDYKIRSVKTPGEALRLAAAKEFDLYVLDYRFPDMTGIEVCKKIREIDPNTRIMFFTGEAHEHERQKMLDACANAYLVKPADIDKLTETAEQLLGIVKLAGAT